MDLNCRSWLALSRVMLNLKSSTNPESLERNILSHSDNKRVLIGCLLIVPMLLCYLASEQLPHPQAASSTSFANHPRTASEQNALPWMPSSAPLSSQHSCPLDTLLQYSLPAAQRSGVHRVFPDVTLWFASWKHCYCTPGTQPPNCCIQPSLSSAV